MAKRPPTKAESAYMAKVADLGCVVCRNLGYGKTPVELTAIHHILTGVGMGQRATHYEVLPLCGPHHQTGGYGIAIHAGQKEWESRYGSEIELLYQVRAEIWLEAANDSPDIHIEGARSDMQKQAA